MCSQEPTSSTTDEEEEDFSTTVTISQRDRALNRIQQALQAIRDEIQKLQKEAKERDNGNGATTGNPNANARNERDKEAKRKLAKKIKKQPKIVGVRGPGNAPISPVVARPKPVNTVPATQIGGNLTPSQSTQQTTQQSSLSPPASTTNNAGNSSGSSTQPVDFNSMIQKALEKLQQKLSPEDIDSELEELKKEETKRKILLQMYKDAQARANEALALCARRLGVTNVPACSNDNGGTCNSSGVGKEILCYELCLRCIDLDTAIKTLSGYSQSATPNQSLEQIAMPPSQFNRLLSTIEAIESKFSEITPGIGEAYAAFTHFKKVYDGVKVTTGPGGSRVCTEDVKFELFLQNIRDAEAIFEYLNKLRLKVVNLAKRENIYVRKVDGKEYIRDILRTAEDEISPVDMDFYNNTIVKSQCLKELLRGDIATASPTRECKKNWDERIKSVYDNQFIPMVQLYGLICNTQAAGEKRSSDIDTMEKFHKEMSQKPKKDDFIRMGLPLLYYIYLKKKDTEFLGKLETLYKNFFNPDDGCYKKLFDRVTGTALIGILNIYIEKYVMSEAEGEINITPDGSALPPAPLYKSMPPGGDWFSNEHVGDYFKTVIQKDIQDNIVGKFENVVWTQFCKQFYQKVIKRVMDSNNWDTKLPDKRKSTYDHIKNTFSECIGNASGTENCCIDILPKIASLLKHDKIDRLKIKTKYKILEGRDCERVDDKKIICKGWGPYLFKVQEEIYKSIRGDLNQYRNETGTYINSMNEDCNVWGLEKETCKKCIDNLYDLIFKIVPSGGSSDNDEDFEKYVAK